MASARQDRGTACARVWALNPRRGSTAFLSLSISAYQSSQLRNTPSSSTPPNEMLWNTGASKRSSNRATPTRPERSPTVSSTLALRPYSVRNTPQFCTPVEHLQTKRNRHTGDQRSRHRKLSRLLFDSNLSSDPGIAHQLRYPCLNHSS